MFLKYRSGLFRQACSAALAIVALSVVPQLARAQTNSDEAARTMRREAELCKSPASLGAAGSKTGSGLSQLLGFFNTGGYFLTGNGKGAAFGSPKFYNDGKFYSRPKRFGALQIEGGAETLTLSDHFIPFTGGNEFDLLGGSVSLTTTRQIGKPRVFVSAGVFLGRLRSVNLNFDRSAFTPSGSVGVEYPFSQAISFDASYRISQKINGISTDGFGVSLRFH